MKWANDLLIKKENCTAIAPLILANQSVWTKNEISSLENLKGKRIRVPDAAAEELLKELGAHPVYMQFSEMNEAVMRGTIDGVLTASHMDQENPNFTKIYHWELLLEVNHSMAYICVNLDAWKELSVDLQNLLRGEMVNKITVLNNQVSDKVKVVHSHVKNPPPNLTVVALSAQERKKLQETGQALINKWLQAPDRSTEAKELWTLIEESRK